MRKFKEDCVETLERMEIGSISQSRAKSHAGYSAVRIRKCGNFRLQLQRERDWQRDPTREDRLRLLIDTTRAVAHRSP
jgi:hypothetical protein